MKNIEKYTNNTIVTSEGEIYKDKNAFNTDFDKICYISEYALDDLREILKSGKDLTDEEIRDEYGGESRNSIREIIYNHLHPLVDCTYTQVVEKKIDELVFQELLWTCVDTWLNECEDELIETFFPDEEN